VLLTDYHRAWKYKLNHKKSGERRKEKGQQKVVLERYIIEILTTLVQAVSQASVKRDLRCIPELIYAIEQFEKELIKLGKKIKVISCSLNHCHSYMI